MARIVTTLLLLCVCVSSYAFADESNNNQKARIVALSPHTVEMLFELGLGEQIVATVDFANFPEQAKNITRVGGAYGLSIEKIVSLNPDYILAWRGGNKANDIAKLESLGFTIIDSSPRFLEDVAADYRRIGRLLGAETLGNSIADEFLAKLSNIKRMYNGKKAVKAFYQMWPEPLMTVNKTTWAHQIMHICGAQNVFANQLANYPQISIENVIVKHPDIIILPIEDMSKEPVIEHWLAWQQVPAVKNKKFVKANADLLHRFTSRVLIGTAQLCSDIDQYR